MENYEALKQAAENGDLMAYYVLFAGSFKQVFYICENALKSSEAAMELAADAYTLSYNNLSKLVNPEGFQIWINCLAAYDAAYCIGGEALSYLPASEFLKDAASRMNIDPELASRVWTMTRKKIAETSKKPEAADNDAEKDLSTKPESILMDTNAPGVTEPSKFSQMAALSEEDIEQIADQANAYKLEKRKKNKLYIAIASILVVCICIGSAALGERLKRSETKDPVKYTVSDEKVNKIASLLSGQLAGQIGEVYQISEDTYYMVIYVGGEEVGDALAYYDESTGEIKLLGQDAEKKEGDTQMGSASGHEGEGYLNLKFSSSGATGGGQGNIDYILEDAIADASSEELQVSGNQININKELIEKITGKAEKEKADMEEFFDLNEDGSINIILRIRCLGVDLAQPFVITLDSAISDLIGNAGELQVIINDDRHAINISKEQLTGLCCTYGSVSVSVSALSSRTYAIEFYDKNETAIPELFGDMTFIFPADSELTYVYAQCAGGSGSRNGKFSRTLNTLSFPVWSSGVYTMMGNDTAVSDVGELPAEYKEAVSWAVSCGLFKLTANGEFEPDAGVSSADFAEAVNGLCTVLADEEGADDGTVPAAAYLLSRIGEKSAVTREEAYAVSAQILMSFNGDTSSEDNKDVISFADRSEISASYLSHVGYLVKQGILETDPSAFFKPRNIITKADAALILHKIYSKLKSD